MVKKVVVTETRLDFNRAHLSRGRLKWKEATNSVDEVTVVDLIQYLTPAQRKHFVNELHRVLKVGCKTTINAPHWCSARAYGDLDVVYPPVSEAWPHFLNLEWRTANAPRATGYKCDFDIGGGYSLHQHLLSRNQDYQQHAVSFWKEAAQDILAVLIKR